MTDSETDLSPKDQIKAASRAFEQEFERFARFTGDSSALTALDLDTAIGEERLLGELRTRHLGKNNALAAAKKLIGRVASEARAAFGQLVQSTEASLVQAIEKAEQSLKTHSSRDQRTRCG